MDRKCPLCDAKLINLDPSTIKDLEGGGVEFECPNSKCKSTIRDNAERTKPEVV